MSNRAFSRQPGPLAVATLRVPRAASRLTIAGANHLFWGQSPMDLWDFLLLLLIAGICGAIGQAIAGVSRGGCLVAIVLGFIGAVLGMWIKRKLELPEIFEVQIGEQPFPIVWSIIGSALFVAVLSLLTRPRRP